VTLVLVVLAGTCFAVPTSVEITPVAIYQDITGAFGLAYDSVNGLIWVAEGDSGDNDVHSLRPWNDFSAGEIAALPDNGSGAKLLSNLAGELDVAGTTSPGGSGGSGSGAHFSALAFNDATGQIAQTSPAGVRAYDPFTAANQVLIGGVGSGFADGLDLDGANNWFSGDVQDILNNGVLFADRTVAAQTNNPAWTGLGGTNALGWSGVEQVGDLVFAVAVHSGADTGQSRTIVAFDLATGVLVFADPDGDSAAARWEDLAFDGRYLYAADLRGNEDGLGLDGDVYVFDVIGEGGSIIDDNGGGGAVVPEPGTVLLVGLGLAAMAGRGYRRRKDR
jgi:hypothetical protein